MQDTPNHTPAAPAAKDSHMPTAIPYHIHAALLKLATTVPRLGRGRGRSIAAAVRRQVMAAVKEAMAAGVTQREACAVAGISDRTLRLWRRQEAQGQNFDHRGLYRGVTRPNAGLGAAVRALRRAVLREPRFAKRSLCEVRLILCDEGLHVGSLSTLYRDLQKMRAEELALTEAAAPAPAAGGRFFYALAPNMLWSMDFTLFDLRGGGSCRLCVVMDVYDRCALAWQVQACLEDPEADKAAAASQAAEVLRPTLETELGDQLATCLLQLRTDGSGAWQHPNFTAALEGTRIVHSLSRHLNPRDNAHSERLWRTLKEGYGCPRRGFSSVRAAQRWAERALRSYNEQHHHSALLGLTPQQYRRGERHAILTRRHEVQAAVLEGTPLARRLHSLEDYLSRQPRPARLRICDETPESFSRRARERQRWLAERAASRRRTRKKS